MECPRCGNEKLQTLKTRSIGSFIIRYRRCENDEESSGCGKVFKTREEIDVVDVFNPETVRNEYVELSVYKSKHLDRELKGQTGFTQPRIFE